MTRPQKSDFIQAVIITILTLVIYLYRLDEPVMDKIGEWYNNGHISEPAEYVVYGNYPRAYRWNLDARSVERVRRVMTFLKARSKGHTMIAAPEFGVNLKLAYFTDLDIFIINPVVMNQSEITFYCEDMFGHSRSVSNRPEWTDVKFVDLYGMHHTKRFERKASCMLYAFLSM